MIGDGTGEPVSEVSVVGVEVEEGHDCSEETLDVLGLGTLTAAGVGSPPFGVAFCGPLAIEFIPNAVDGRCRCPDSSGENLAAVLLLYDPMLASGLHSTGQGGIAGRQENPAIGHGLNLAVGGSDGVRRRAKGEGGVVHSKHF
jgi:hypothetical protein